jgi:dihydroxyacetone kinase-like predicted kinase
MNPSTEDLLKAVDEAPAETVILLPNNSNVILTANQVAGLTTRSVGVVPTRSVPQALVALASFNPAEPLAGNLENMNASLSNVTSVEITRAVRDVELNGVWVGNGQVIGLVDDELVAAGDDIASVAAKMFEAMGAGAVELVTVFSGADATAGDVDAMRHAVAEAFADAGAEFHDGGQPHYLFVISLE